jgi:energy-coupling factor transporter transmembrane protein EcfT
MSKFPPQAVLLATLAAVVAVTVADTPTVIFAFGAPALLAALRSARSRRIFARRLLVTAPLFFMAALLGLREHAQGRDLLSPALRVASAIAWSSCLSTWLEPRELGVALRALGAPAALVELIAHTRRFERQLAETTREAWNAAALRGGLLSAHATARTVGQIAGVIVVRAFDRAECVALAGALRGGHLADELLVEELPSSESYGGRP